MAGRRTSMFDEKYDFIKERVDAGVSIKMIWQELGEEWYSYDNLCQYINKYIGKPPKKNRNCEKCAHFVLVQSPYRNSKMKIAVCLAKKQAFRRDRGDMPYDCELLAEKGDY